MFIRLTRANLIILLLPYLIDYTTATTLLAKKTKLVQSGAAQHPPSGSTAAPRRPQPGSNTGAAEIGVGEGASEAGAGRRGLLGEGRAPAVSRSASASLLAPRPALRDVTEVEMFICIHMPTPPYPRAAPAPRKIAPCLCAARDSTARLGRAAG